MAQLYLGCQLYCSSSEKELIEVVLPQVPMLAVELFEYHIAIGVHCSAESASVISVVLWRQLLEYLQSESFHRKEHLSTLR